MQTRAGGNTIKTMAESKLENIVTKSMQIIQSTSYKNQPSSGGEAVAFPSPTYDTMYAMVLSNSTSRPMVAKKRDIAFKEGINIEKNFAEKCIVCGTEFTDPTPNKECVDDTCKGQVREPDFEEKNLLSHVLKIRNTNGQRLVNVLKEISVDHDIVDDGWLVVRNVYQEIDGVILKFEPEEFWRVHPANMAYSMDGNGRIGFHEYTCLFHRDYANTSPLARCSKNDGDGVCNRALHPVIAVRMREQRVEMRYIRQEVFHGSEYQPTAIYGYPPALTLWYNLLLTSSQEKFMADYYVEKKFPTAVLFVPTKKRETAVAFKENLETAVQQDNQARPVFRFDPDAKHKPEIVKMMDSPEEMQFTQVREEARMRMSAFWGVAPIFNSDVQSSGGLNNESRQLTIMAWATETKQKAIEEHYLEPLVDVLNIKDWHYELGKIEEEDEASAVNLDILKAQHAQTMASLGFEVSKDEDGNFVFEKADEDTGGIDTEDPMAGLELNTTTPKFDRDQSESLKTKAETFNDYPESAVNNAKKVLKWRDEHGRDEVKGATRIGWTRANQLANKEKLSKDTIRRMASFNRHRKNAEVDPKFKDTPWKDRGYVAWLTWGGTSGVNWAVDKSNSFKKTKASDTEQECVSRKIPIIKDENPDMEIDQVIAIAYSYCQKAHKHKGMRIPFEELFYSIIGTEDEKNYRPADFVEKAEEENDFKFGYYRFTDDLGDWNWQDDYELVDYQNVGLDEITVNEDFMIRDSDIEKGSERVRPLTIIHYLNDKKEMKPLIVDMNYNLLDGHHRYYCCEKKDQIMVRVARVRPKTKLKKKEEEIKQKSPIKAPKGGVTVNGKFYQGGMFLPKEATENLTEEQKEAVARGEDVDTTQAETTQEKETVELDELDDAELDDLPEGIVQEMRILNEGDEELVNQYKGKIKTNFDLDNIVGEQKGNWYTLTANVEDLGNLKQLDGLINQNIKSMRYTFSNVKDGVITLGILNKNDKAPKEKFHGLVKDTFSGFDAKGSKQEPLKENATFKEQFEFGGWGSVIDDEDVDPLSFNFYTDKVDWNKEKNEIDEKMQLLKLQFDAGDVSPDDAIPEIEKMISVLEKGDILDRTKTKTYTVFEDLQKMQRNTNPTEEQLQRYAKKKEEYKQSKETLREQANQKAKAQKELLEFRSQLWKKRDEENRQSKQEKNEEEGKTKISKIGRFDVDESVKDLPKAFENEEGWITPNSVKLLINSEIDFVKQRMPQFEKELSEMKIGTTTRKTVGGYFRYDTNGDFSLMVNQNLDAKHMRHTIRHELGHAIDMFQKIKDSDYDYEELKKGGTSAYYKYMSLDRGDGHGKDWKDTCKALGYDDSVSWSVNDVRKNPDHPNSKNYSEATAYLPIAEFKGSEFDDNNISFMSKHSGYSEEEIRNMDLKITSKRKSGVNRSDYEVQIRHKETGELFRLGVFGKSDIKYEKPKKKTLKG